MCTPTLEAVSFDGNQKTKRLTLNERLALIGLINEEARRASSDTPIVGDLFDDLWDLVDKTVSGATIDRLDSGDTENGFKVIAINAESGENLGRLNMLYLNKPIPCYYLVYVEVAAPYRRKGLGNRILKAFRDFLMEKSAVGLLDNIIPADDPTYDIYLKLEWTQIGDMTGTQTSEGEGMYMVFVPPSLAGRDLKDSLSRLVYHLKRRRAAIDMRDNELMVQRTIEEFKDLYSALLTYFDDQIRSDSPDAVVRYMFTRFVTKLLGFRRRISQLLGYTGGESLEQIVLDPAIRAMPVQSYAPKELASRPSFVTGDPELWLNLPEALKQSPARIIESLPNYHRPSFLSWLAEQHRSFHDALTIGDLLDLGFDPTRLKEISLGDREYIFERLHARLLSELEAKKAVLEQLDGELAGATVRNTRIQVNPPLLVIRDRGNAYVLRRKVEGIHWEEAVEQLQTAAALKTLNEQMSMDRMITATVRRATDLAKSRISALDEALLDKSTVFVAWNFQRNEPKIVVDFSGSFLESLWIA